MNKFSEKKRKPKAKIMEKIQLKKSKKIAMKWFLSVKLGIESMFFLNFNRVFSQQLYLMNLMSSNAAEGFTSEYQSKIFILSKYW